VRFIGRASDLATLDKDLARLRKQGDGAFLAVRGRRRVGKSRLLEHWIATRKLRHVFFSAPASTTQTDLELFRDAVAGSTLPVASTAAGLTFNSWQSALTLASQGATKASPLAIVIDEFPYLIERQEGHDVESGVQHAWDRALERLPVVLVLVGSDIGMMKALAEHGRALFNRPTREMLIDPLSPAEIGDLLRLAPADTIDAYLMVGGFPGIVRTWPSGADPWRFLSEALSEPDSSLIVNAERILSAEFPTDVQARQMLKAIGSGETTYTNIMSTSGLSKGSMDRSLPVLVGQKRVVAAPVPLSTKPSSERRYFIADPYLRFWLRFIEPAQEEVERGRGTLVRQQIRTAWPTYRGRAVEPLVRAAITRLLPDPRFGDARHVGGYWTRTNVPEVDLVGIPDMKKPRRVSFVGSVKWRDGSAFDTGDLRQLTGLVPQVPGTDARTLLVAAARGAVTAMGVDVTLGPQDLIDAWR
jgi:AAA+ ATPase superfamily predicted ATPase